MKLGTVFLVPTLPYGSKLCWPKKRASMKFGRQKWSRSITFGRSLQLDTGPTSTEMLISFHLYSYFLALYPVHLPIFRNTSLRCTTRCLARDPQRQHLHRGNSFPDLYTNSSFVISFYSIVYLSLSDFLACSNLSNQAIAALEWIKDSFHNLPTLYFRPSLPYQLPLVYKI